MIARALIYLGLVDLVMATLIGFGFAAAHVPYASPLSDWVWGFEWAGLAILTVGLVLKEVI